MSDGEIIGTVLLTMLVVFGYGYWAILSGRGWPFRDCDYPTCHQFFHFRKHRKSTLLEDTVRKLQSRTYHTSGYGNVDITMGDGTTKKLQPEVIKFERVPVDKGMYLKKNGKAHECDTPKFTWERGSTLDTQWMCQCGQTFQLVARAWKSKPDRHYLGYARWRDTPGTPGRKLSYADVLKVGNTTRTKSVRLYSEGLLVTIYEDVDMSPEEIINDDVSFTWEAVESV